MDCTTPVCTANLIVSPCGVNKLCVGPDQCACKPGFRGANCDIPQCVQVLIFFFFALFFFILTLALFYSCFFFSDLEFIVPGRLTFLS